MKGSRRNLEEKPPHVSMESETRTKGRDAENVMSIFVLLPPSRRKRFSRYPTGADGDGDGDDRWDDTAAPAPVRVSSPAENPQPFDGASAKNPLGDGHREMEGYLPREERAKPVKKKKKIRNSPWRRDGGEALNRIGSRRGDDSEGRGKRVLAQRGE